jgi:hypothetical protein
MSHDGHAQHVEKFVMTQSSSTVHASPAAAMSETRSGAVDRAGGDGGALVEPPAQHPATNAMTMNQRTQRGCHNRSRNRVLPARIARCTAP